MILLVKHNKFIICCLRRSSFSWFTNLGNYVKFWNRALIWLSWKTNSLRFTIVFFLFLLFRNISWYYLLKNKITQMFKSYLIDISSFTLEFWTPHIIITNPTILNERQVMNMLIWCLVRSMTPDCGSTLEVYRLKMPGFITRKGD